MHTEKENESVLHTSAHEHPHGHRHIHANKQAVSNRLARAIGHLEKVRRMVENDEDCSAVLIQLAAVRSALENAGKVILQEHIQHSIIEAVEAGDEKAVSDLCDAIDKFVK